MSKVGLVLEGGGVRGAYTAGALTWLYDNNIKFDYGVGISSGAVYLCLYELGRMDSLKKASCDYATRSDIVGAKAFLKEGHYVSYLNLFRHYLLEEEKVDIKPLKERKANIEVGAYDLKEGKTNYYGVNDFDENLDLLRGTCALPIASAVVETGGKRLLDGGITKMIPIERAIEMGCEKCLVITTKPADYVRKPASKILELMMKINYKECPQVAKDYHVRHLNYYKQINLIKEMCDKGEAVQVFPSRTIKVSRFKGDPEKCEELFELGYQDMEKSKEAILDLFK